MALFENGSLFSAEPITRTGLVDNASSIVPWARGGRLLNVFFGDGGYNGWADFYGFPPGYVPPVTWVMPIEDGGMYVYAGTIAGSGGISSSALGIAKNMSATIHASSIVTAGMGNLPATATITATSTVTANMVGAAQMVATIQIAGVNAQNVANAVWNFNLESNYTSQQLLRALVAVAINKSIVVPGSPVHVKFRDLLDQLDRINATMDGSQRTSVTLNL